MVKKSEKKQNKVTNAENVEPAPVRSTAEKIWDDIKNVQLELFTLPGQIVSKYCTPTKIDPNKLYLTHNGVGAVLPALETAFSKKYNVELVDKYIVISVK